MTDTLTSIHTPKKRQRRPTPTARPRYGRIGDAVNYSSICRTRLYELARQYRGLFRKNGGATVVDYDVLDAILDELPVAKIKG
jgi:hypothetical protein